MKQEPIFRTEAALCAAFSEWAHKQGWTPYAETGGWDVVLVAGDGTQIGVQAKLRFNLDVLSQALEEAGYWNKEGPDFRAVLVPNGGRQELCHALGLTLLRFDRNSRFYPDLPCSGRFEYGQNWHYTNPEKRIELPKYVPDVTAGASAPIQLTKWKVAALRIVAILDVRGYVTRQDFRSNGVDYRRWINYTDWLAPGAVVGQFIRGKDLKFDVQHPVVFQQIRSEVEKELSELRGLA